MIFLNFSSFPQVLTQNHASTQFPIARANIFPQKMRFYNLRWSIKNQRFSDILPKKIKYVAAGIFQLGRFSQNFHQR